MRVRLITKHEYGRVRRGLILQRIRDLRPLILVQSAPYTVDE